MTFFKQFMSSQFILVYTIHFKHLCIKFQIKMLLNSVKCLNLWWLAYTFRTTSTHTHTVIWRAGSFSFRLVTLPILRRPPHKSDYSQLILPLGSLIEQYRRTLTFREWESRVEFPYCTVLHRGHEVQLCEETIQALSLWSNASNRGSDTHVQIYTHAFKPTYAPTADTHRALFLMMEPSASVESWVNESISYKAQIVFHTKMCI